MDAIVLENHGRASLQGTLPFSVTQSLQVTNEDFREQLRAYSQGASDDVCSLLALLEELFKSRVIVRVAITGMRRIDIYLDYVAPDGSWLLSQHRLTNLRSVWKRAAPDIPLTIKEVPEPDLLQLGRQRATRRRRRSSGTRTDWVSVVLDFISDLLSPWGW